MSTISGPDRQGPIEGVGSPVLQRLAKLPGCAGAVKVFCQIFHLDVPSSIKAVPVNKAQAKPLHSAKPEQAGLSVAEAVKSAKQSGPIPPELQKLAQLKQFLAPWDPPERMLQGKSPQERQELAAKLNDMEGLKNDLAAKGLGSAWVNQFNKLKELTKPEKTPKQPAAVAKGPAWGDNKHVESFGQLKILLQDQFLKIRQSLSALTGLSSKSRAEKSQGLKDTAANILDNYRQYRALLTDGKYDSLSPEEQNKIDAKIQASFGVSHELFYEIKELAK